MPFPRFLTQTTGAGAGAIIPTPPVGQSTSSKLPFKIQAQQQTDWCWAAVTASVADFYGAGSPWMQCNVANATLGRNDCCAGGGSDPTKCNIPYYLETALTVTGHLAGVTPRNLTLAEVQREITRSRPLGCRVEWHDGSGHFLAVVGVSIDAAGVSYLDVADPIFLDSQIPFLEFAALYQTGALWTHSYFTNPPAAGGALMAATRPRPPQHPDAIGA